MEKDKGEVFMSRMRVHELAKELNMNNKDLIERLLKLGVQVKNHMSTLTELTVQKVRQQFAEAKTETIEEKRIGRAVIRRRKRVAEEEVGPLAAPLEEGLEAPLAAAVEPVPPLPEAVTEPALPEPGAGPVPPSPLPELPPERVEELKPKKISRPLLPPKRSCIEAPPAVSPPPEPVSVTPESPGLPAEEEAPSAPVTLERQEEEKITAQELKTEAEFHPAPIPQEAPVRSASRPEGAPEAAPPVPAAGVEEEEEADKEKPKKAKKRRRKKVRKEEPARIISLPDIDHRGRSRRGTGASSHCGAVAGKSRRTRYQRTRTQEKAERRKNSNVRQPTRNGDGWGARKSSNAKTFIPRRNWPLRRIAAASKTEKDFPCCGSR